MLSFLGHVSGVDPAAQPKLTSNGQAYSSVSRVKLESWRFHIALTGVLGKEMREIPIKPVMAFPSPHMAASPDNINDHLDGILSARIVKSIATRFPMQPRSQQNAQAVSVAVISNVLKKGIWVYPYDYPRRSSQTRRPTRSAQPS